MHRSSYTGIRLFKLVMLCADIVCIDYVKKYISVIEISVAHHRQLAEQRMLKINRYSVNSTIINNELILPYNHGPNLIADLYNQYHYKVDFLPAVVGSTGEFLLETKNEIKQVLDLNEKKVTDLLERMARSAVIGTSRIIKNHFA